MIAPAIQLRGKSGKCRVLGLLLQGVLLLATFSAGIRVARADNSEFPPDGDCGKTIAYIAHVPSQMYESEPRPLQRALGMTFSTVFMAVSTITATTVCLDNAGAAVLSMHYEQQERFARDNALALIQDMARGGGSELRSLASLMGCSPNGSDLLATVAQQYFEQITTRGLDGAGAWQKLGEFARTNESLKAACLWA